MARKSTEQPTDGELNILNVLWQRGPCRLSEVCEALNAQRPVAATTVATILKIMSRKGQVERVSDDEGIRWQAKLSQRQAGSHLIQRLVERVFEGSTRKLVLHLLEAGHLSAKEQQEISNLLVMRKQLRPTMKRR